MFMKHWSFEFSEAVCKPLKFGLFLSRITAPAKLNGVGASSKKTQFWIHRKYIQYINVNYQTPITQLRLKMGFNRNIRKKYVTSNFWSLKCIEKQNYFIFSLFFVWWFDFFHVTCRCFKKWLLWTAFSFFFWSLNYYVVLFLWTRLRLNALCCNLTDYSPILW